MWQTLHVEMIAPPFAGHLFPLLDLAMSLQAAGITDITMLCTRDAGRAIAACGLRGATFLAGREDEIHAIANPGHRVGSHPLRLLDQFRRNLGLMGDLRAELRQRWTERRPDVVIADFTVPVAGMLARSLGSRWWSSTTTPSVIETRRGTPSYLGGWMPAQTLLDRLRDRCGRRVIRSFKQALGLLFAKQLRSLDIPGVYRPDGHEIVYSPERILACGYREFEFERDWPPALEFVGGLTGGPAFPHEPPTFEPGRLHILVSLGTHVAWAKDKAFALLASVAERMPECVFHITHGQPGSTTFANVGNVRQFGYIPYDTYLPNYAAAVVHGGAGVVYSCLKAAVPTLVWPQDFDHYDIAARIVFHRLGLRLTPRRDAIVADLKRLLSEPHWRESVERFRHVTQRYDPAATVLHHLQTLAAESAAQAR